MSVTAELSMDKKEMRASFCDALMELAEENPNVVLVDADLMTAMGTRPFALRYPERTVDCGVQEANMIGVAAGLSALGKIPFAHTFGCFASRRAYDQVYMSGAYARLNIKLIGSDPGVTAALNGGTHMPFEDMGTMRSIPGMIVLEPTDAAMLRALLRQIAGVYGMHYVRLVRKTTARVYDDSAVFEIGKAVKLLDGADATVIASGYCVAEALKAARELAGEGIHIRLLNMFTWKPIDREAILAAAEETGTIVTAENHNVTCGLGAAVADAVVKHCPVPMEMVGVQDEFGEVGPVDYLAERFGLTAPHICAAVRKAMARKRR